MSAATLWCAQDCIRIRRHDIAPGTDVLFVDVDDCMRRVGYRLETPMARVAEPEVLDTLSLQLGADSAIEDDTVLICELIQYP